MATLAGSWFIAAPVQAQQGSQPQFKTVVFSRAPGDERTDTVVGKDPAQTIIRVGGQLQSKNKIGDDDSGFIIRTDLPGPERLFDARKSEATMQAYIRRDSDSRTGPSRVIFPEYPPLTTDTYTGRSFARSVAKVEPSYVCHGRLYFEQPNFERGGWDLGYVGPGVQLAVFYYDVFMLPYHAGTNPCVHYDCSAGKCLPGDQSPFYLYREQFSVSGLAAQTLAVGGGFFAFP